MISEQPITYVKNQINMSPEFIRKGLIRMKEINNDDFKQSIATGYSVVKFSAKWCVPCQQLNKVLEEAKDQIDSRIKTYQMDIDVSQDTAQEQNVMSIPCLVKYKDGVEVKRALGMRTKSDVLRFINEVI